MGSGRARRVFQAIERRRTAVLAAVLVLTILLAIPFLLLAPDSEASTDPPGEVFDTAELVDDRLVSPLFTPFYIAEARDGDMLLPGPLLELLDNEQEMRADDAVAEKLFTYQSADYQATVTGIYTIADAIDQRLRAQGLAQGLAEATDADVKAAAYELLRPDLPTADFVDTFSVKSIPETRTVSGEEITWWTVPALMFAVLADNEALGGGGFSSNIGGDETVIEKEEYSRDIQTLLRGDEGAYKLWGVAIDANLTSNEEGATAGPFIMFTIITVLIVVAAVLRSYWAVALVGGALAILMVWLRGISNLIGLDNSLVMAFIVPIAMISFGVDFAFHAIGRCREEAAERGSEAGAAYVAGLSAVVAALLLALMSDSLAFLSNTVSGIPAILQFGIGATIALASAFTLLGVVVPLALLRIEARLAGPPRPPSPGRRALAATQIGAVCLVAGVAVLLIVFFPPVGVVALAVYLAGFVGLPLWVGLRRPVHEGPAAPPPSAGGSLDWVGTVVEAFGHARYPVLAVAATITGVAAWFAVQVEASFDVEDFFSSSSAFVVGLDKIDEHSAGGEPAVVYVESDLTDPRSLAAIRRLVSSIDASESGRFGRNNSGDLQVTTGALDLVEEAMGSPVAQAVIAERTGADLTDADDDGLPDSPEAIAAIYRYAQSGGIPGPGGMIVTPDEVPSILWMEGGPRQATIVLLGLTETREQSNIVLARDELDPLVEELERTLKEIDPGSVASLTGSPITRQEGLDATVRALITSLPIAVVLCLIVAAIFMRSARFAVVAIVPILLVVTWLYALMHAFGFALNIVTATIGAISIGVGIDFAIHFTMRYREELERLRTRTRALRACGAGTGAALLASALSSMVGFAVMAFAPMPMFATYGLLTAIMIALAAAASLIVLPALLMVITQDGEPEPIIGG